MPNSNEVVELIELIQRGQEAIDAQQRQERALTLEKFAGYHADTKSDYQRALDEIYRVQRLVVGLETKVDRRFTDMQVEQGTYKDEEHQERQTRQGQNDAHFRRIYLWLVVLSIPALFIAGRILWLWWGV